MINLLPDEMKKEIVAARHNILLIRYILMSLLAIGSLYMVTSSSEQILSNTKDSAEELIATNTTEAGVYSETKQKVTELSTKLSSARTILDQEVKFSDLITGMAALMPEGTIIKELKLNKENLSSPTTIIAFGKTTESILEMQTAFRGSMLFSSVEFQTIDQSESEVPGYPVKAPMTVVFNQKGLM